MRKSIIVYYSQTGNTQKIAQAIDKGMSQRMEQCDIFRLKEIQPEDLINYDLIGLGSPVWGGRPSPNMDAFIENFTSLEGKHGFFFCTHGAIPGTIMSNIVPALRRKGLTVIGWGNWYGGVTIPYWPKPYYTDGHPDAIDFKEAEDFAIEMAERSLSISRGSTDLIPKLPQGKEYDEIYGRSTPRTYPKEYVEARFGEIKINEEKCSRCLLCADNCPTNNIDFSISPPVFKTRHCARCWYCEQICPEGAIEYDWDSFFRLHLKYSSTGADDREIVLAAAEAKGRFRRLVPPEDVSWDNAWYRVSKHPRLTIP